MERRTKFWVRLDGRAVRLRKSFERAGKLGQLSRGIFAELKLTLRAERAHLRRERIVMCNTTDASATTHDVRYDEESVVRVLRSGATGDDVFGFKRLKNQFSEL